MKHVAIVALVVVGLLAGALLLRSQAEAPYPRWEYVSMVYVGGEIDAALVSNSDPDTPGTYSHQFMQMRAAASDPTGLLPEYLNILGTDGWELVSVESHLPVEVETYIFKRPI